MHHFAIEFVHIMSGWSSALNECSECISTYNPAWWDETLFLCHPYFCGAVASNDDCIAHHHRSASYLLQQVQHNTAYVFRFVDFRLCVFTTFPDGLRHGEARGLASYVGSRDMIIGAMPPALVLNTTIHEISHNLGAYHIGFGINPCNLDEACLMHNPLLTDIWCTPCQDNIWAHRRTLAR